MDYQNQMSKCAGKDTNSQSRQGLLQTLALLYGATQRLKRPQNFLSAYLDLQVRKMLKPQTILNYWAAFCSFVDCSFRFDVAGDNSNHVTMNSAIKNARRAYSTAATKSYRFVAQEMRAKVPSCSPICARYTSILKLLKEKPCRINAYIQRTTGFKFLYSSNSLEHTLWTLLDLNWEESDLIYFTPFTADVPGSIRRQSFRG